MDIYKDGVGSVVYDTLDQIQGSFEELCVIDRPMTVLNGRIRRERSDSTSVSDIEYEFHYSASDAGKNDYYEYTFDTYPVADLRSPDCDLENEKEILDTFPEANNNLVTKNNVKQVTKTAPIQQTHKTKTTATQRSTVTLASPAVDWTEVIDRPTSVYKKHPVSRHTFTHLQGGENNVRKASNISRPSTVHSGNRSLKNEKRKSVSYDPVLEKASAFIHGGGKNFSRANTTLYPVRYGLKHLQTNYTETNLESNPNLIFLDLLKSSKQAFAIRHSRIQSIERRLESKRNNPLYSTTFYEHKNIPDPFHRDMKKTIRSAAQKKLERKKKIKHLTDKLHTGYVPTHVTMTEIDKEQVEAIGQHCRYLRGLSEQN